MQGLKITISLCGDLGTPLRGDTLFGQLCWAIAFREGVDKLEDLLKGYAVGRPFLIVSDACPEGFLPKPELPAPIGADADVASFRKRKAWSKRKWLEASLLNGRLSDAYRQSEWREPSLPVEVLQSHNTINRMTGTTGTGMFAPYQTWRLSAASSEARRQDVYICCESERFERRLLDIILEDVGKTGYGRDASLGLGKFDVVDCQPWDVKVMTAGKPYLALGPCIPEQGSLDASHSFWRPFTRFGRHGGLVVGGKVFKTPVLMADTGAVVAPTERAAGKCFVGTGVGGDGSVSRQITGTVHQGYAPIIPLNLDGWHG